MSSTKKHPHIKRPTLEDLQDLLQTKPAQLFHLYLHIHLLVLEVLPDVYYSVDCQDAVLGYGAHQYGYNGWGMAGLAIHGKWVTFMFMLGVHLEDLHGILEGRGKKMRHVKFHSWEEFHTREHALRDLITRASSLQEG